MIDQVPGMSEIHFVPPEDVYGEREKYAILISRVLDGCYGEDYPGTSLKPDKNLKALLERTQRSAFWAITKEELKNEQFGTSSMVDASAEFGEGFAEMGKSGSLGGKGAKLGYMRFFAEWEQSNPFLDGFDSLVTTVRNCPERAGKEHPVKSGIGIRIIFLKYLQFQQWGIAPWLLMPDDSEGTYEVLDLLFQFRDKSDLIRYIQENRILLNSVRNRELLNKFLQYNLGIEAQFEDQTETTNDIRGWNILIPSEKIDKNPVKLVRAENDRTFEDAYRELEEQQGAMYAIYLPLTAETNKIQQQLEKDGWVLTGFIPGKTQNGKTSPIQGMWSKLRTTQPLVAPDYFEHPDDLSPNWYYEFVKDTMTRLSQM